MIEMPPRFGRGAVMVVAIIVSAAILGLVAWLTRKDEDER